MISEAVSTGRDSIITDRLANPTAWRCRVMGPSTSNVHPSLIIVRQGLPDLRKMTQRVAVPGDGTFHEQCTSVVDYRPAGTARPTENDPTRGGPG